MISFLPSWETFPNPFNSHFKLYQRQRTLLPKLILIISNSLRAFNINPNTITISH